MCPALFRMSRAIRKKIKDADTWPMSKETFSLYEWAMETAIQSYQYDDAVCPAATSLSARRGV